MASESVSRHGSSYSSAQPSPFMDAAITIDGRSMSVTKGGTIGATSPLRCTRTRWAVGGSALLLLVAVGIGLGVGLPMVVRKSHGKTKLTSLPPPECMPLHVLM
jgi:hypothetical protein